MKKFLTAIAAASAALVTVSAAYAEPVEGKNLLSGKDTIDPEKGYIYLHGPSRMQGVFLKVPSEEDVRLYEQEWEEEFLEARSKYEKKVARYEKDLENAKKIKGRLPEKPEEVTRENFGIDPIELRGSSAYGPMYIFSKDKSGPEDMFSYMNEVEPGTYVYYGPLFVNPNGGGFFGVCFCMGSVQFEVKPGVITNLGNFLNEVVLFAPTNGTDHTLSVIPDQGKAFPLATVDFDVPASLGSYTVEKADFRASRKYDNYYGVAINRMPAVEGILAYDRDRPVDLKAEIAKEEEVARAVEGVTHEAEAAVGADAQGIPADAETPAEPAVAEAAEPE